MGGESAGHVAKGTKNIENMMQAMRKDMLTPSNILGNYKI
jgi:hypothetical protein